jgi:hypothetical protein
VEIDRLILEAPPAVLDLGGGREHFLRSVVNYPTLAECDKVAALDAHNKSQYGLVGYAEAVNCDDDTGKLKMKNLPQKVVRNLGLTCCGTGLKMTSRRCSTITVIPPQFPPGSQPSVISGRGVSVEPL